MQISDRLHLVGSGSLGFDLTDSLDCHVYLLDGGDELALVDAGAGRDAPAIVANVRRAGLDPEKIRHVVLTHAHADHAGGAAAIRPELGEPRVYTSAKVASWVRTADETGFSLAAAKAAGIYPDDYRLQPCPVEEEVTDGDEISVGDLALRVLETPGHAAGHLSFLLEHDGMRSLFAGDAVFFGGYILLQNTPDCSLDDQKDTIRRLRGLDLDGFFPSHLAFSLREGQRHVERANEALDRLLISNQLVTAW